jgi:hypothetical protein
MWKTGQPSGVSPFLVQEDCIDVNLLFGSTSTNLLNDNSCSALLNYICE